MLRLRIVTNPRYNDVFVYTTYSSAVAENPRYTMLLLPSKRLCNRKCVSVYCLCVRKQHYAKRFPVIFAKLYIIDYCHRADVLHFGDDPTRNDWITIILYSRYCTLLVFIDNRLATLLSLMLTLAYVFALAVVSCLIVTLFRAIYQSVRFTKCTVQFRNRA